MKHLKKFETVESDSDSEKFYIGYENDILEIKDIIISLKDEYPDIDVMFKPFIFIDKKIKGLTLKIIIGNVLPKGDRFSINYSILKLNLIESILKSLERIEKSINKKCKIINIWESTDEILINII